MFGDHTIRMTQHFRNLIDYVTFYGLFPKRTDAALIRHSGLITLDFDHVSNLQELRDLLLRDRYFETELMFVSPSGDGLKWIISIDLKECNHQDWFKAVAAYLKICCDLDFQTAMTIATTLEKHAIAFFQNLHNNDLKGAKLKFFEKLPPQFDRQGYLKVAEELGIQPKTAEKYIGQFKPKLLSHEHNLYLKL